MTSLSPDDEMSSSELAPRRMLEGGGGEHARRLLASARLDRVPVGAKARVAGALGDVLEADPTLPCEPEGAARGNALARLATRSGLYIVGAGIVGAIAVALWLRVTPGESSTLGSTPRVASAPLPGAAAPGADTPTRASPAELTEQAAPTQPDAATRRGDPTLHAAPIPQAARAERHVPPREARSARQRTKLGGETPQGDSLDSGLLAEVHAIEAVSAAIGSGQADRAARELEAYRRRFARGELAIEADVLDIQIATLRGDHEAASASAQRLLARPEAQHYRARVLSLLESEARRPGSTDRENAEHGRSNEAAVDMRARR
jgi:hypothetical protein